MNLTQNHSENRRGNNSQLISWGWHNPDPTPDKKHCKKRNLEINNIHEHRYKIQYLTKY